MSRQPPFLKNSVLVCPICKDKECIELKKMQGTGYIILCTKCMTASKLDRSMWKAIEYWNEGIVNLSPIVKDMRRSPFRIGVFIKHCIASIKDHHEP